MHRSSNELRPGRHLLAKENNTPSGRQSRSRQKRSNVLSSRSNLSPLKAEAHSSVSARPSERNTSAPVSGVVCQNHKAKEAKYRIVSEDDDTLFYCEKCSIFLASQGFAVEKLEQQPTHEPAADNELQAHIEHVLKNLEEKEQAIRKKIVDAEHYRQEIEMNLDAYFKKIMDYIGEKKKEFKKFVENEHRKLLQGYQEHEVQIQNAIIQTEDIKEQISDRSLDASERSYFKTCIMKTRIMCQKLDVMKGENKKDIVTIDLSEIVRIIDENLKIKVKVADTSRLENSCCEEEENVDNVSIENLHLSKLDHTVNKSGLRKSIGESEIKRVSEHYNSVFSNDGS